MIHEPPELLRVEHACKRYDGAVALDDAHLSILKGEVLALMGENGAGKSTMSKILAGAVKPDSAEIAIDGQSVTLSSPAVAQRMGIGIIYQELDLFPHLTIAENIVIGNLDFESRQWVNRRRLLSFCRPFLEQVGLNIDPNVAVGKLPIGQMQLVAIARALSLKARLILMDEPTSALTDDAVQQLFQLIRQLQASGVSIVYVSHKMEEIFQIADRITVMRDGKTVGTKLTSETNMAEIIRMMVGRELSAHTSTMGQASADLLLQVDRMSTSKLRNVSFDLRHGEVLGVAGLVGAGRSELGAALFGIDRITGGTVALNGTVIKPLDPRTMMNAGIGLVPEDRKLQGLMMQMSVRENATMATLGRYQRFGFLARGKEQDAMAISKQALGLKAASDTMRARGLSGGNQQKVLLAKVLLSHPDVLFLDDPTRGIDVGAKQDIYQLIARLAGEGKGIIFVSSELPELLGRCHRILVMREGRCAGILDGREASQESIMHLATMGSLS